IVPNLKFLLEGIGQFTVFPLTSFDHLSGHTGSWPPFPYNSALLYVQNDQFGYGTAALGQKASISSKFSSLSTIFRLILPLLFAILSIMGKLAAASPHQLSVSTKKTS